MYYLLIHQNGLPQISPAADLPLYLAITDDTGNPKYKIVDQGIYYSIESLYVEKLKAFGQTLTTQS